MGRSTLELAHARAREVATDLERRLGSGNPSDLDLLKDVWEVDAHADGALVLVLEANGPHVSLVLGRGLPHVEVWWGGDIAASEVSLNGADVDQFMETWWPRVAAGAEDNGLV
jgi:hypothetical protein